jgi:hypothetical protein
MGKIQYPVAVAKPSHAFRLLLSHQQKSAELRSLGYETKDRRVPRFTLIPGRKQAQELHGRHGMFDTP